MAGIAILWVLAAILSIQGGAAFAKQLFPLIGSEATTFLRVWISALILIAIGKPWRQRLSGKAWKFVALYGACLGMMNYLFYLALERIPLGVAVALEFTGPLAVAVLSSRKGIDFIWAFMAAMGIFLILPQTDFSQNIDGVGVLFALGAGIGWGLYIIFAKQVGRHIPGGNAMSLGMLMAALTVTPFSFSHVMNTTLNMNVLVVAVFVALLSSALPYSLEMKALRHVPAKTFGVLMSLEPAVGALIGLLFLHEKLSSFQWLAIGFIMLASAGSSWSHNKHEARELP